MVGREEITDEVIAQRGAGQYIPRHIKSFRFKKGLDEYLSEAEIVISNCGAGTIMENVTKGHRLIVIQNPDVMWRGELGRLPEHIETAGDAYALGEKYGLAPGNPDGTYFQDVPLVGITASGDMRLEIGGGGNPYDVRFGDGFMAWTKRSGKPHVINSRSPL